MTDEIDTVTPAPGAAFDINRVFNGTISTVRYNFLPFFLAALVILGIPQFLFGLWTSFTGFGYPDLGAIDMIGVFAILGIASGVVVLVCQVLLQGAIIHASICHFNNERVGLRESVNVALTHIWPLIGFGFLAALGIYGGALLIIIPGVILAVMWSVGVPALVVENTGVMGAFARSRELTRGYRWWILLVGLTFLVIIFIISAVGEVVLAAFRASPAIGGSLTASGRVGYAVITSLMETFGAIISAAGTAAVYYELRYLKEGISPKSVAAVFD